MASRAIGMGFSRYPANVAPLNLCRFWAVGTAPPILHHDTAGPQRGGTRVIRAHAPARELIVAQDAVL